MTVPRDDKASSGTSQLQTAQNIPKSLLAAALAQIRNPVLITTADLERPGPTILYVNKAFTDLTGYTMEDVRGKTPRILQGKRTDPMLLQVLKRRLREEEHFRGETVNYRKDGSEYIIEWEIAPVKDVDGTVTHWVSVQRDVTERHLLEREVLDVSTREQQRIAEDLHDNLGQSMTGILMRMRAMGPLVDETGEEELKSGFAELTQLIKKGQERLRRQVRELYPVSLADDGLVPGLRELASNAEVLYGITCRVGCDAPLTVASSSIATHLYRITQEAITNAVQHGHATVVEIRVEVDDSHLLLTIENNGERVTQNSLQKSNGMGVRIMEQRARAIQAGLAIQPSDKGTKVVVSLKNEALIRTGSGTVDASRPIHNGT